MTQRKLTVADKLVVAANNLEKDTGRAFSAEDLVVRSFLDFNDTFGLRGHIGADGRHLYPDSNRVFAEIMGTKPLRARGLLERTGDKMYRLTAAGRALAEELDGSADQGTRRATMTRDDLAKLRRYLGARAVQKYSEQRSDEISFTDACAFWGISPGSNARALNSRRADLYEYVERGKAGLQGALRAAVDNAGKVVYTAEAVDTLLVVDRMLENRFARELQVITDRRDER